MSTTRQKVLKKSRYRLSGSSCNKGFFWENVPSEPFACLTDAEPEGREPQWSGAPHPGHVGLPNAISCLHFGHSLLRNPDGDSFPAGGDDERDFHRSLTPHPGHVWSDGVISCLHLGHLLMFGSSCFLGGRCAGPGVFLRGFAPRIRKAPAMRV